MECQCGSSNFIKRGEVTLRTGQSVQRYQCKDCGTYSRSAPIQKRSAKILLLDIETQLMEFYNFSPYVSSGYIPYQNMIKDWSISCWAAKWLFEPEVMGAVVTSDEAIERSDASVMGELWKLLDEANIVIWHNGDKFDGPKINTRFILNGYHRPSHYLSVDTNVVAKGVFGNSYNHLEELGRKFGIGVKSEMEFDDWIRCAKGDKEALQKMIDYCKRDVAPLLEDVYLKLLPWMKNHPNLNLFTDHDNDVCPNCESANLDWSLEYTTPQGLWSGFRCLGCGAVGRGNTKGHKIKSTRIK